MCLLQLGFRKHGRYSTDCLTPICQKQLSTQSVHFCSTSAGWDQQLPSHAERKKRSPTRSLNPTWGNLKVISSLVSPAWMAPSLTAWEPKSWPTTSPFSPSPSCGFLIINHPTIPHLLFSLNPSTILHTSVFSSSTILQTCIAPKTHSLACQQEDSLTRVGLKRG